MIPRLAARARRLDDSLSALGTKLSPLVFLALRLIIGFECVRSGAKHLINFDGTSAYFASLHIPFPDIALVLSALAEIVGGALLMLGWFVRLACVPLLVNFLVAYLTSGRQSVVLLFTLQDAWKFVTYPAFPFLLVAAFVFVTGAGGFSLDALQRRREPADRR